MKRHNLLPVHHPFVEIECSGEIKKTEPVVNEKKNPMFPNPILIMDVVSFVHGGFYKWFICIQKGLKFQWACLIKVTGYST